MSEPLVPADVDLRDFDFMPLHVTRLRDSELRTSETPAACWAAVLLWCTSWHQVPAGSLPDNDRYIAEKAGYFAQGKVLGSWKSVRSGALRGFVKCSDGRLYHPVVAEKALEAWLAKLADRLSSGAGNAKRWGTEFDPAPIAAKMDDARRMLSALNPESRALSRKRTAGVPKASKPHPDGNPDGTPESIPTGSQQRRTLTGTVEDQEPVIDAGASAPAADQPAAPDLPPPDPPRGELPQPTDAGRTCLLLRGLGLPATNPSHAELVSLLAGGCTPEEIANTARELLDRGHQVDVRSFGYVLATVRNRRNDAARRPAAVVRSNGHPARLSPTDPRAPLPSVDAYSDGATPYDPAKDLV